MEYQELTRNMSGWSLQEMCQEFTKIIQEFSIYMPGSLPDMSQEFYTKPIKLPKSKKDMFQ